MKVAKVILEETLNKIGGFKDKGHENVNFIINKGVLTILVRNETDYAMRMISDADGVEEMEPFTVKVTELMNVLSFSDSDSVEFNFVGNKVQIKSGIIDVKVGREDVSMVSKADCKNKAAFKIDADAFNSVISIVGNAVEAVAQKNPAQGCLGIEVKNKVGKVQALADGSYGIFDFINIDTDKDFTLHIPKEKIQLFKGMSGQYKGVYDIDNQIFLASNNEYLFLIKLKSYNFTDFRELLKFGDSLGKLTEEYDVALSISRDELSKYINLFKTMNEGVHLGFDDTKNINTLMSTEGDRVVSVELQGKAYVKDHLQMFHFDIKKLKWIQYLKEDMVFIFFKKCTSEIKAGAHKIVPFNSAEGGFDDISTRRVGILMPASSKVVDSFYANLKSESSEENAEIEEETEEIEETYEENMEDVEQYEDADYDEN